MAANLCRIRPILARIITTCERRNLYSVSKSRAYALALSSNIFRNSCSLGLPDDKVPKVAVSAFSTSVRCFSSEKRLTQEEITEKVLNVCKTFDRIPADKLTLDSHFMEDLGLDSLDHVELIMNIEDDFNFEIPDADAEKLLRPKDIVAYIEQKELVRSSN